MQFLEDFPLAECNTLRLPARARWFARIASVAELEQGLAFCRRRAMPALLLGGGSNVVLHDRVDACVLRIETSGEELLESSDEHVELRVAAGVNWHAFVLACHARGWYGLENLALIPGTVGAAPIQNIGAYGVELAEFVCAVAVLDRDSGARSEIRREDCGFGYRHSRFKHEPALVITALRLRLSRRDAPRLAYPALREELAAIAEPRAADVLAAVIAIRRRRLPDPALLPNAGSFFKNPIVDAERFARLRERHPDIVHWSTGVQVKLAAAWLVDRCGWKGYREGAIGVHAAQALVLVNHGGARAGELLDLAARIRRSVLERFDVELELEPAVY